MIELLQYNFDHIDFIDEQAGLDFDCPLDIHCTYSRDPIPIINMFYVNRYSSFVKSYYNE